MKVLLLTAMWPTEQNPAFGSFVKAQADCLQQAGLDLEVFVLRGRHRKLIYPRGILELRRRLAGGSFDLVHAHYGLCGIVARTQWLVPVVVTFHGDDAMGTFNRHGKKTIPSLVTAYLCRQVAPFVDAVIVQSQQMARLFPKGNVHILPHEVDLRTFHPTGREEARRALGLSANKKYLLFAANPEIAVKRFPLAQAAFDLLRQRDPSVELVVLFKETQPRLALYMSACDALVFPSYQEGSPNIVKQAMACNLPIFATDVGDVREVIESTPYCYICRPDAAEFASRLEELLRVRPRTQGRQRVQHLDGPAVANSLIALYTQVLERRMPAFHNQMQPHG